MPYNFAKRPKVKLVKNCTCTADRYKVPLLTDIPDLLKTLTQDDIYVPRPIEIHAGDYDRRQHEYRVKHGILRLSWSDKSVQEKINLFENRADRPRCQDAYDHLMTCNASSYSTFVQCREDYLKQGKQPNLFHFRETIGIECCLWPHLYPSTCIPAPNGAKAICPAL